MSTSAKKVAPRQAPRRTMVAESSTPSWYKWVALLCAAAILVAAGAFALNQKGLIAIIGGQRITQDDFTKLANYFVVTDPEIDLSDAEQQNDIFYYTLLNAARLQLAADKGFTATTEEATEDFNSRVLPMLEIYYLILEGEEQDIDFDYQSLYYGIGEPSISDQETLEELLGTTGNQLFQDALSAAKMSQAEFIEFIRQNLIMQALDDDINEMYTVSEEEIAAYYEENKATMFPPKYTISHILQKTIDDSYTELEAEVVEGKREMIYDILQRLESGEDFAALADELSDDRSETRSVDGGYLGSYTLSEMTSGQFVSGFGEAAATLTEIGQITGVVETMFGYHIIRLDAIEEQTLEDVRYTINSNIAMEKSYEIKRGLLENMDIRPDNTREAVLATAW